MTHRLNQADMVDQHTPWGNPGPLPCPHLALGLYADVVYRHVAVVVHHERKAGEVAGRVTRTIPLRPGPASFEDVAVPHIAVVVGSLRIKSRVGYQPGLDFPHGHFQGEHQHPEIAPGKSRSQGQPHGGLAHAGASADEPYVVSPYAAGHAVQAVQPGRYADKLPAIGRFQRIDRAKPHSSPTGPRDAFAGYLGHGSLQGP